MYGHDKLGQISRLLVNIVVPVRNTHHTQNNAVFVKYRQASQRKRELGLEFSWIGVRVEVYVESENSRIFW